MSAKQILVGAGLAVLALWGWARFSAAKKPQAKAAPTVDTGAKPSQEPPLVDPTTKPVTKRPVTFRIPPGEEPKPRQTPDPFPGFRDFLGKVADDTLPPFGGGSEKPAPTATTPTPGAWYRAKKGDLMTWLALAAYGDRKLWTRIADSAKNGHLFQTSQGFESYGRKGPALWPRYAAGEPPTPGAFVMSQDSNARNYPWVYVP